MSLFTQIILKSIKLQLITIILILSISNMLPEVLSQFCKIEWDCVFYAHAFTLTAVLMYSKIYLKLTGAMPSETSVQVVSSTIFTITTIRLAFNFSLGIAINTVINLSKLFAPKVVKRALLMLSRLIKIFPSGLLPCCAFTLLTLRPIIYDLSKSVTTDYKTFINRSYGWKDVFRAILYIRVIRLLLYMFPLLIRLIWAPTLTFTLISYNAITNDEIYDILVSYNVSKLVHLLKIQNDPKKRERWEKILKKSIWPELGYSTVKPIVVTIIAIPIISRLSTLITTITNLILKYLGTYFCISFFIALAVAILIYALIKKRP